ncbi:iron-containing alcohol dehydrogenase [Clostridium beijerinckii]|uniref:NADH-dependent butanol dehydrogenase A n=1 Tax=Clostridium beijerinckii TaxID=1520 RepID=A0AAX0B3D1_CLOBE|nr:iron-containing alcohol dehydrogenase [Clostridium beijerinckii]NRT88958.1 hypothetical protein [Clostridium beijerinckii]NYC74413.1 alcohol dehydrogenase YqhD (iron-dependent ADH family) [Clostridium beijerinckii]
MINFNYSIPTKIFFGKGQISVLGSQIKKYGSKILLVYGHNSVKKNGLYDKIVSILKYNDIYYCELPNIDPNPRITSVKKGVDLCKKNSIELILAIGGGSVIDCAKAIGAAYYYDGDAWDIVIHPEKITNVLPIASILTIAATGSEMDQYAVISNTETCEKLDTYHPDMYPKFSILDPTYTFTVSANQTAAGTADIMSHILEIYFHNTKGAYLQDRMAEALLKTCIKYGKIAIVEPESYEARANLMWASSLAINDLLNYGIDSVWSVHPIEHELSAFYDISHGVGLAILTPYWMEYVLNDNTVDKFKDYGINVWGLSADEDKFKIAHESIKKTRDYFLSLGLPSSLKEIGISDDKFSQIVNKIANNKTVGNFVPLNARDIMTILKNSL